ARRPPAGHRRPRATLTEGLMRLGLNIGYSRSSLGIDLSLVQQADPPGFPSVWSAEAYGSDAVSPLCWIAAQTKRIKVGTAIMQIPARTPTLTATTALTIDQLAGGRFILGLGVSGPQVVEGWHGVAFGKPLAKTREYVDIVRMVWKRERPVEHKGEYYQIPYAGPDATGLGKPLKSILHGRSDIPIYLAAIGPKNVALAAEIADGLLPVFFSPERLAVFTPSLAPGFGAGGGGARTSTTSWGAATATRATPSVSRISTWGARRTRRRRRCPTRSWTRSRCAARGSASRSGWPARNTPASPR